MAVVHCRATKSEIRQIIAGLARAMAGREPDHQGLARGVQLRIALKLLSKIQQAFIKKSRGEASEDGIVWNPLLPATIAQRRMTRQEKKTLDIGGRRVRGLLTPAEDREWRKIFRSMMAMLRAKGVGEGQAQRIAASIAWSKLKAAGAKTKLAVLGSRKVDIGRDTGRMYRSLTPGIEGATTPDQIVEVPPGAVIVGSNVPYFPRFHKKRPVWPAQLPEAWWEALIDTANRGLLQAAKKVLESRR